MYLTPEQQGILDGAKGETQARVMYDHIFGADKMVPVTSECNPHGVHHRPPRRFPMAV